MILKRLRAKNFRTLEDIEIEFTGYYTAISGKNNAGKSNIIKVIRTLLSPQTRFRFRGSSIFSNSGIDWKEEITSWKKDNKEDIFLSIELEIDKNCDSSIYKFFTELIFKDSTIYSLSEVENLKIEYLCSYKNIHSYKIFLGNQEVSDDFQKKEVLKRIRSTECLIFHNSTNYDFNPFESKDSIINFITSSDLETINKKKDELVKIVQKSLKNHQIELTKLLGNLEDKYEVSFSTPGLNFERESIDISLKEKGADVSLDDWGSGTRNRTMIFLSLLNAKRYQQSSSESDRISPIIVIEEPECFLHPQAQAEFGRILQDLANQFKIQIITTTHSPYLLSFKSPNANILLQRDTRSKSKDAASHVVDTNTEKWYEPFAVALGISHTDLGPIKDIVFSSSSRILLVEGVLDKEYFEFFQSSVHGDYRLDPEIEIFPYGGADSIKNNILMNFVRKKFQKIVLTVDLDRYSEVKKAANSIGFKENIDFFAIGKEENGKKCIEGLVPLITISSLTQRDPELLQRTVFNVGSEQKSAKSEFKRKLLEEFKLLQIDNETFKDFYSLIKKLNKAFK